MRTKNKILVLAKKLGGLGVGELGYGGKVLEGMVGWFQLLGLLGFVSLVWQSGEERGQGREWDLWTFIVTFFFVSVSNVGLLYSWII